VTKEVKAEGFDFFGIAPGGVFDGFGAGIAQDTASNGNGITLLLIFFKEQGEVALAEALLSDFDAGIGLLLFPKDGNGSGTFGEVAGVGFGRIERFEETKDLGGGEGDGGGGKAFNASLGDVSGEFAEVIDVADVLLVIKPMLVAALAPTGEIGAVDGYAVEVLGKDFFDGREFVKPSQNFGVFLSVEETLVKLFPEFIWKPANFSIVGVLGIVVVVVCLRGAFDRRDVDDIFVSHAGILLRKAKCHSSSLPLF
jgi:hypothetical protein